MTGFSFTATRTGAVPAACRRLAPEPGWLAGSGTGALRESGRVQKNGKSHCGFPSQIEEIRNRISLPLRAALRPLPAALLQAKIRCCRQTGPTTGPGRRAEQLPWCAPLLWRPLTGRRSPHSPWCALAPCGAELTPW